MTCNCSQLGELPGIIAKPEYQVCYQKVYARVNYNAKDTNGNFPCRVNPCYSLEFVEKTISTYQDLVSNRKIEVYNQKNYDSINNAVAAATGYDKDKVAAVLYELYYYVIDKNENVSKDCLAPPNSGSEKLKTWGIIIGTSALGIFLALKFFGKKGKKKN